MRCCWVLRPGIEPRIGASEPKDIDHYAKFQLSFQKSLDYKEPIVAYGGAPDARDHVTLTQPPMLPNLNDAVDSAVAHESKKIQAV